MAKGKLILICQSGGEFATNDDGTMLYSGGEANAVNVTQETTFNDLKLMLAEACNLDQKTVTIKYFLPGNKKNLITVKNDKDVKRMIDFHGDAITAEVFVTGMEGFDHCVLDVQSKRESGTKKDETLNQDNAPTKKDKTIKHSKACAKKNKTMRTKKDNKLLTSPPDASPAKRTRRATAAARAAANAQVASDDSQVSDDAKSDGSSDETSSSAPEREIKKENSDSGSDYAPRRSAYRRKRNEIDVDTSPADTVKKRRRTPSWKFGANGRPTIVSVPDKDSKSRGKSVKTENSGGGKSQRKSTRLAAKGDGSRETKSGKKRGRRQRIASLSDDSDQELDIFPKEEHDFEQNTLAICNDDASPETVVDAWKSAITGIGQEFDSVNEFRAAMKKYAIANRFGYRFKKNDTSRAIGGCAAEGCSWKFYAVWVPTTQSFMIKTLNNVHTCDKDARKSAHPAKNWLVGTIKDRLRESPYLKPKEIANGLLQDFGVELNYTQVWRGIGDAREQLHGSPKESYNKLPWFCEKIMETNPGSIAKLVIGDKKRFKSLFVSFYALIRGFQNSCRPLIFFEATSLKSRYGEVLLTANAIDGNDGFIPVAFAIVDVEDDNNWCWFMEQLKAAILNSGPITFVFDREKSLKKIVLEVFEDAHVGYSIYHLLVSFKRNIKGPCHGDGRAFLPVHFLAAAHAVRPVGFKKATEQIKLISSQAYDWVMQIEPEHWVSSSFKGERYNYITEDVGESYAKLMEDYRHLPILQKIDALIRMIINDLSDAKLDASMWSSQLTALKEKELEEEKVRAHGLKVLISSDTLFEVREDSTHVVNISNWSCTCMGWKETGLPCRHALAVFALTGKNPYEFCSSYFTVDAYRLTYAESINPIPIDWSPMQNNGLVLGIEEGGKVEGGKGDYVMDDCNEEIEGKIEKEEGFKEDCEMEEGETLEVQKEEGSNVDVEKDEGRKLHVEKDESSNVEVEKDEGSKLHVEKDESSNVDAEKVEGSKLDVEKDGSIVDTEIEDGSKLDTGKEEGSKLDAEKDEGSNIDVENVEGSNIDVVNVEGSNIDVENIEGGNIDVEKEEDHKLDAGGEEGEKLDVNKEEGTKLDAEKEVVGKLDAEKEECSKLDAVKEDGFKLDAEKEEGNKLDVENEEGSKLEVEKEVGSKIDVETGGRKLDAVKEEGSKLDVEKEEGGKLDVEKEEGEKEGGSNIDVEEEGRNIDVEKEEGRKYKVGKEEGEKYESEKEEGKLDKMREEHEDPNVLVLPPVPARGVGTVKKEMMESISSVETEAEIKRRVTCSRCKQPGHYKKSCKTKL